MSLYNELPIALPIYDKKEHQDRFREEVAETCAYQQISPRDALLPFQFTKPVSSANLIGWIILVLDSETVVKDITVHINMIRKAVKDGKEYYTYDGSPIPGLNLAPGYYFTAMYFTGVTHYQYSEVFRVPADHSFLLAGDVTTKFLKLEWWNDSDIRPIFYNDLNQFTGKPYFRNVCYMDTYITACEPETTITGDPDGDDEQIRTEQKVVYTYRITDLVSDSLKKALALMPIHDHIVLTTPGGIRSGEITGVLVNTSLEADGARSNIEITFRDSYVVKRGCENNMP